MKLLKGSTVFRGAFSDADVRYVDLSVEVTGKTLKDVAQFVSQKLATLDQVQSTMTNFVLKRYKEKGVILDDKEQDRRQVITP